MAATASQFMIDGGLTAPEAIRAAIPMYIGGYSCIAMHDGQLIAFRDPHGIRPLEMGRLENGGYVFASETCALDALKAHYVREVAPGEMIVTGRDGDLASYPFAPAAPRFDIFEIIYFMDASSRWRGQRVADMRSEMGRQLAQEHPILGEPLVIGIPRSAVPAGEAYAEVLKLEYRQAITKHHGSGRNFTRHTPEERREAIRQKFDYDKALITGRDIVLVDDSIVRMDTIKIIVEKVKEAGARSVTVLSASPPIRFPNFYGVATADQKQLIAATHSIEKIQELIGCQYLGYLSLSRLVAATGYPAHMFELSCFTGEYPIDIGEENRSRIVQPRDMAYAA